MGSRRLMEAKSGKGASQLRKEKAGNSRKKESALSAALITGWNLPFLNDENDIVNWMKREKNGDNKTKPRPNEEKPEERFRHDFTRCKAVENEMEFERESLHERYRKHCQFGPRPLSKREATLLKPPQEGAIQEALPARKLRYPRSCKSAELPATPKETTGPKVGLEMPDFSNLTPLISRSHSVIDDVQLTRYGLTLPPDEKTARLLELAERFTSKIKNLPELIKSDIEEVLDEGYDSKVSSNDADGMEDDGEESKVGQYDAASVYTNLESIVGIADTAIVGDDILEQSGDLEDFTPDELTNRRQEEEEETDPPSSNLSHRLGGVQATDGSKDAIAKLMYSRRGRNIYEGIPSRRCKDNTFKYAGKEQSRLMETSLNHITPGYLNIHHFAHLSGLTKNSNSGNVNGEDVEENPLLLHVLQQHHYNQQQLQQQQQPCQKQQQQQRKQQEQSNTNDVNSEQRTVPMRMISLQDRNDLDGYPCHHHSGKGAPSPADTGQDSQFTKRIKTAGAFNRDGHLIIEPDINSSTNGASNNTVKAMLQNGSAKRDIKDNGPHLCINDMSSNVNLLPNKMKVGQPTATDFTTSRGLNSAESADQSDNKTLSDNHLKSVSPYSSNSNSNNNNNNNNIINNIQTGRKTPHFVNSVLMKYCQKESTSGHGQTTESCNVSTIDTSRTSERGPSTTFFPVADLLPAVEKNLRRRKKKGQLNQQMMYRSQTMLESLPWKRYESDVFKSSHIPPTSSSPSSGTVMALGMTMEDLLHKRVQHNVKTQKAYGPPGFRPHHSLSPLQRAKEIVNRRLHGHVTQLPDGSETLRVTSPQYQTTRLDRINSASRKLGRVVNGTWREYGDTPRSKSETAASRENQRALLLDVHLRGT